MGPGQSFARNAGSMNHICSHPTDVQREYASIYFQYVFLWSPSSHNMDHTSPHHIGSARIRKHTNDLSIKTCRVGLVLVMNADPFGWKQHWHSLSTMHGRENDRLNEDDHAVDKINRKNIRAPIKMLAAMC